MDGSVSDVAIRTQALVKSYGSQRALDGVSVEVKRGGVFGLLGPNGAGKTTLVRLLSTLIRPDAGRAWVLGHDVVREAGAVRSRLALTGQFASLDEDLTGRENLLIIARLLGLSRTAARARVEDLLSAFGLAEAATRQVRAYSGGMRRRLDIAASIMTPKELLVLDEPTTGLDPRSRAEVWSIIRELGRTGTTVLLTTQYLEEADQLAERVAVIDKGRLVADGTSAELKAQVGSGLLRLRLLDGARSADLRRVASMQGLLVRQEGDSLWWEAPLGSAAEALPLLTALSAEGVGIAEFAFGQPSLDAVFFALTGHPAAPREPSEEAS